MGKITPIEEYMPHKVSEVVCLKCRQRWIAVRPEGTMLKDIECPNGHVGDVIETGGGNRMRFDTMNTPEGGVVLNCYQKIVSKIDRKKARLILTAVDDVYGTRFVEEYDLKEICEAMLQYRNTKRLKIKQIIEEYAPMEHWEGRCCSELAKKLFSEDPSPLTKYTYTENITGHKILEMELKVVFPVEVK